MTGYHISIIYKGQSLLKLCVKGGGGYFRVGTEITASYYGEGYKIPIYGESHKITSDMATTSFIAFVITVHCIDGMVVHLYCTMNWSHNSN